MTSSKDSGAAVAAVGVDVILTLPLIKSTFSTIKCSSWPSCSISWEAPDGPAIDSFIKTFALCGGSVEWFAMNLDGNSESRVDEFMLYGEKGYPMFMGVPPLLGVHPPLGVPALGVPPPALSTTTCSWGTTTCSWGTTSSSGGPSPCPGFYVAWITYTNSKLLFVSFVILEVRRNLKKCIHNNNTHVDK